MDQLRLSGELIDAVQAALVQADERARDPFIALQYLAALGGFILGRQDMPTGRKLEIQEELNAFQRHVLDDVDGSVQQQRGQEQAFGIWKPGQD